MITTYGMGPAMEQIGISADYGFRWATNKISVFSGGSGGVVSAAAGGLDDVGYSSFYQFKKAFGSAGKGNAWHHVVEQNPANLSKFSAKRIHSINNLIKLPNGKGTIHARLSGYYSSIQTRLTGSTTMTVRQWLSTKSFDFQYNFGVQKLVDFGWKF